MKYFVINIYIHLQHQFWGLALGLESDFDILNTVNVQYTHTYTPTQTNMHTHICTNIYVYVLVNEIIIVSHNCTKTYKYSEYCIIYLADSNNCHIVGTGVNGPNGHCLHWKATRGD